MSSANNPGKKIWKTRLWHELLFNYKVKASQFYKYVVVQFYPWFKFYFLLFLGMIMYDNEFGTKENKI